tara:strand:- start:2036 stop:2179 length:144 start_codon:yes stop_codon:yes gene_type:complete
MLGEKILKLKPNNHKYDNIQKREKLTEKKHRQNMKDNLKKRLKQRMK